MLCSLILTMPAVANVTEPVDTIPQLVEDSCRLETAVTEIEEATADSINNGSTARAKMKQTKNWLKRFFRSFDDYDTSYISPNYYNYTAMLQNTNFYQIYRMKGTDANGVTQTLQMSPSSSIKIGPYFGWRWIFLGYTFDVSRLRSATKTTEFNLSLYSSMLGCDLVYIRNTGDFRLSRVKGFSDDIARSVRNRKFTGLDTYTASANVYYVFNHRHFSYPAAYAQSTVQRKSCGSWILGFNYSQQRIKFDYRQLPSELLSPPEGSTSMPLIDELKIKSIDYKSYSLSGGYAYNWVFARNWLFSISFAPALGLKQVKGERIRGESLWIYMKNLKFDFISRAGIVWNNAHYFVGASVISHLYDYQQNSYSLSNNINYVNVYVGFTFNKKRQYRHLKHLP